MSAAAGGSQCGRRPTTTDAAQFGIETLILKTGWASAHAAL